MVGNNDNQKLKTVVEGSGPSDDSGEINQEEGDVYHGEWRTEPSQGTSMEGMSVQRLCSHLERKLGSEDMAEGFDFELLGRKIGFKALETRLQQMWVRKGFMSIIDPGSDYFLVHFTNDEDQEKALRDGMWLIYDHYLTVRECHQISGQIAELLSTQRLSHYSS